MDGLLPDDIKHASKLVLPHRLIVRRGNRSVSVNARNVIDHIVAPTGARVYQHEVKTEQAIPSDIAGDAVVAMRSVVDRGTGVRAHP